MSGQVEKFISDYSPYLNDLWRRLYLTTIVFFIWFVIGFFSAGWVVKFFIYTFNFSNVSIVVTSPFQFLNLAVDIGLFIAIVLTAPLLMWHLYAFLHPAFSKKEFHSILLYIPLALILFLIGFAYGFFVMYIGLRMLAVVNVSFGLKNFWDVSLFLSQLTVTAALLGILFQFPIFMSILIKLGLVSRRGLQAKRRLAYAIIVIIVALLPPTDALSLILMSVPMVLLYELTIIFNWRQKVKTENRLLAP